MGKKLILFMIISTVCIVLGASLFFLYTHFTIDTQYAKGFAEAFADYDIEKVDGYLEKDTKIICKGQESTYSECRENLLSAFEKKAFVFSEGASYGYGNNSFEDGVQKISVSLFGEYMGEDIGMCSVEIKLRRHNLIKYFVESIESDCEVFEHLFFGDANH
ncbi:MAG: hypothetical protein E7473_04875 [Ruminococcaceae bacterium]|nr:hypothetical protein [Oscillospiraceae bacterium]